MLGILVEIGRQTISSLKSNRNEIERLLQPIVRFRTTEPQEPFAGFAEAFTPQTGDAEFLIRSLEQIQSQSVACNSEPIADWGHVRKDIESGRRVEGVKPFDSIQTVRQQLDLLSELLHHLIAFLMISL